MQQITKTKIFAGTLLIFLFCLTQSDGFLQCEGPDNICNRYSRHHDNKRTLQDTRINRERSMDRRSVEVDQDRRQSSVRREEAITRTIPEIRSRRINNERFRDTERRHLDKNIRTTARGGDVTRRLSSVRYENARSRDAASQLRDLSLGESRRRETGNRRADIDGISSRRVRERTVESRIRSFEDHRRNTLSRDAEERRRNVEYDLSRRNTNEATSRRIRETEDRVSRQTRDSRVRNIPERDTSRRSLGSSDFRIRNVEERRHAMERRSTERQERMETTRERRTRERETRDTRLNERQRSLDRRTRDTLERQSLERRALPSREGNIQQRERSSNQRNSYTDENNNERRDLQERSRVGESERRMATPFGSSKTGDVPEYLPKQTSEFWMNIAKTLLTTFLIMQIVANSKMKKYGLYNFNNLVNYAKQKVL